MILEPIITEKTTKLSSDGKYTFRVEKTLNKYQIKELVEKVFKVKVKNVKTLKVSGENKRTMRGRKKIIKPTKKAIVTLEGKDKIDLFESKKK